MSAPRCDRPAAGPGRPPTDNGRPPADLDRLTADLVALGLPRGGATLVHCSMRRLGPVDGGAATLLAALRAATGPGGTVVVPAHTTRNSTTSRFHLAAVAGLDPAGVADHIARIPAFDPERSPVDEGGAFAEFVRRQPGARRSNHPQTSFAAVGPAAGDLLAVHDLDCHLGERSPVGRLYGSGGQVLLLGVGYAVCTVFHLAEYRLPDPPRRPHTCFVRGADGRRERIDFTALDHDDSDFAALGAAFAAEYPVTTGPVGAAKASTFPVRPAVDFALRWMRARRRNGFTG